MIPISNYLTAEPVQPSGVKPVAVETNRSNTQLIDFLQEELAVSAPSIAMALRHCEQDPGPLHMILWQYGLVSLEQLEKIFDWLEG
jgi:hypothetical protein